MKHFLNSVESALGLRSFVKQQAGLELTGGRRAARGQARQAEERRLQEARSGLALRVANASVWTRCCVPAVDRPLLHGEQLAHAKEPDVQAIEGSAVPCAVRDRTGR